MKTNRDADPRDRVCVARGGNAPRRDDVRGRPSSRAPCSGQVSCKKRERRRASRRHAEATKHLTCPRANGPGQGIFRRVFFPLRGRWGERVSRRGESRCLQNRSCPPRTRSCDFRFLRDHRVGTAKGGTPRGGEIQKRRRERASEGGKSKNF